MSPIIKSLVHEKSGFNKAKDDALRLSIRNVDAHSVHRHRLLENEIPKSLTVPNPPEVTAPAYIEAAQ